MLLEIIITLELIAFAFLALGLIPFRISPDSNPLLNKIVFLFISATVFLSLALTSTNYDYASCYINETTIIGSNLHSNVNCQLFTVEGIDLSYINWGFGIVTIVLGLIVILVMAFSTKYQRNQDDD